MGVPGDGVDCPYNDGTNEFVNESASCIITWQASEEVDYSVEIGGSSFRQATVIDSGTSLAASTNRVSTFNVPVGMAEGIKLIRIYARDSASNTGVSVLSIFVDSSAPQPRVFAPLADWSIKSLGANNVTFQWSDESATETAAQGSGVDEYEIEVGTDFIFATSTTSGTAFTDSPQTISTPGIYYWRVRSRDAQADRRRYEDAGGEGDS